MFSPSEILRRALTSPGYSHYYFYFYLLYSHPVGFRGQDYFTCSPLEIIICKEYIHKNLAWSYQRLSFSFLFYIHYTKNFSFFQSLSTINRHFRIHAFNLSSSPFLLIPIFVNRPPCIQLRVNRFYPKSFSIS